MVTIYQNIQTTIHVKIEKTVKGKQDHEKPGKPEPPKESVEKDQVEHFSIGKDGTVIYTSTKSSSSDWLVLINVQW